ncbi:hypothetical protein [Microcella sp.]|uniref:hypothetical protein n=1 Tax=Microcella sp. TaxID=1913979 RepID=UPI00255DE788|nr:hypothetical protein [Microcella sp.]MBX9472176.1 hypothetical protein [Microcella sp.]
MTHYGNEYVVTPEIAEIFLRQRRRLLDAGQGELVPLPHAQGVAMLWVEASVPCGTAPITVLDGEDVEAARRRWGLCRRRRASSGTAGAASDSARSIDGPTLVSG